MSLADDLRPTSVVKGPPCTFQRLLPALPPDDADALRVALTDPLVTHAAIARALRRHGHPVQAQTVQRHRSGECKCR